MKEIKREQRQLDLFDKTFLSTLEGADFVFGTIRETIKNVDRLQRLRKGGGWHAKT